MAKTMLGSAINESPVIVLEAKEAIAGGARAIAMAVDGGKAALPSRGAAVIGITVMETDEALEAGEDVEIQIKDIGKWVAGEAVAIGDELTADAAGKAVKASGGDFIVGYALTAATAAGSLVQVQITKSGYKPAA